MGVPVRGQAIDELLKVILGLGFFRDRDKPLAEIVPFLSEQQVWEISRAAQQLPTLRQPNLDNPRAECLSVILPRLADFGHTAEALQSARALSPEWVEMTDALVGVAGRLPAERGFDVLMEAHQSALNIPHEWPRAGTLSRVSVQLARLGYPVDAVRTARMIEVEFERLWALTQMIEHLPEDMAEAVLREVVDAVAVDRFGASEIPLLYQLALHLVWRADVERALDFVVRNCSSTGHWWEQRPWLAAVTAHFAEMNQGDRLLARVRGIEYDWARLHALAVLANAFPAPLRQRALADALQIRHGSRDWLYQAQSLSKLASLLPPDEQPE